MDFLIKNKVFVIISMVLILGLGSLFFDKVQSTPEQTGVKFLKNLENSLIIEEVLSNEDLTVFKKTKDTFLKYLPLSLVKIPVENVVFKEKVVTAEENVFQVFYEVDGRKVGLRIIEEDGWKVSLNLPLFQKIYETKQKLKEAELSGDDEKQLELYNVLNSIDPQSHYGDMISLIARKIDERYEKEMYLDKIKISKMNIKKERVEFFIQNTGNRNVSKVLAQILIEDEKTGELIHQVTHPVFEMVLGSKLYGKSIPAGFEQKVNIDLGFLSDTKSVGIKIIPIAISFE